MLEAYFSSSRVTAYSATMVECIHVFPCASPPSQSVDGNKLIGHRPISLETLATSSWCRTAGYQLPLTVSCPGLPVSSLDSKRRLGPTAYPYLFPKGLADIS